MGRKNKAPKPPKPPKMGSLDPPKCAENGSASSTAAARGGGAGKTLAHNTTEPPHQNQGSETEKKRKSSGVLPLDVGTKILCRWRDGKYHPVRVIERRKMPSGGPNDYEYYVHYTECNTHNH